MSECIRDCYEKTSLRSLFHEGVQWRSSPKPLVSCLWLVFSLQCLLREFAAAGGEVIIHGAPRSKTSRPFYTSLSRFPTSFGSPPGYRQCEYGINTSNASRHASAHTSQITRTPMGFWAVNPNTLKVAAIINAQAAQPVFLTMP